MFKTTRWKRLAAQTTLIATLLPATAAWAQTITVVPGDTLGKIASRNQITVEQLKLANHLTTDMIESGQTLYIPPRSEIYTVKSGDVLWKIAAAYQTTIPVIKEMNQRTSDELLVGEKLLVPPLKTDTQTPSETGNIYTVVSGDVLWKIADRYGVSIQSIIDANQLTSTALLIGQKLVIPSKTDSDAGQAPAPIPSPSSDSYTVVKGDVLWKIADKFGVSIQSIVVVNQLSSTNLSIGQVLLIPKPETTTKPEEPVTDEEQTQPQPEPPKDTNEPWVEYTSYKVVQGDTPWSISIDHGIPMTEFLQVNRLSENASLQIGQTVTIPIHHIPETPVTGPQYGEYLDWFEASQYLFPINAIAEVTDFRTGKSFKVKRTIGASHSDTEPLTSADTAIIKEIWGGNFSWSVRPVIVEVDGRRIAGSMTSMPHSIEYIADNDFTGHFDIHFLNSLRHKDNQIDPDHQKAIKVAAGQE